MATLASFPRRVPWRVEGRDKVFIEEVLRLRLHSIVRCMFSMRRFGSVGNEKNAFEADWPIQMGRGLGPVGHLRSGSAEMCKSLPLDADLFRIVAELLRSSADA